VTLDSDTERLVRDRMRREGVSFKRALNDAIRDGAAGARIQPADYVTQALPLGTPRIGLDRASQVAADLEDEELVRRMQAGS
jgi:hypothetical protein